MLPSIALLAVLLMLGVAAEIFVRANSIAGGSSRLRLDLERLLPVMQQIEMQETAGQVTYAADADLGALIAPLRNDVIVTPQFKYTLRTDHAGFPNRDPWPGALDVAVLGDSLLMGPGVGLDGQFTTLLQDELGGRTLLNFAVPGAGTEHQLRIYRKYVAALHPHLVVATIWITWDIDNSLQFNRWHAENSSVDFTKYRLTFGDTHPGDAGDAPSRLAQLVSAVREFLRKSHLLHAIYLQFKSVRSTQGPIERVALPSGETLLLAARDQRRLAQGLQRPAAPDIKEIFFRPLLQLKQEVEAQGGRFVVLLVPSKEEIYAARAFPEVLRSWREVTAELAARRLPVLDLYPVFRREALNQSAFFRVDAHLNPTGNRLVAEALAQWITREKVFRSATE